MAEAYNKIGFHTGPGGNPTGIGDWMRRLDAAGIPFFLKSVDNYGPLWEAAGIARASGIEHHLVFRLSTWGQGGGLQYDVPPYDMTPKDAAIYHWTITKDKLPPEFDKELVWAEPINEVDKDRSDWLGHFAAELAELALNEGYKVTLFGWSSGEPEPEHWQTDGMRRYLTMCAANPGRLAVSLHEYSYTLEDIRDQFPNKVGRFQTLFDACDEMNLARPTVHITEWGWTHEEVPSVDEALADIEDIAGIYAQHPQIKGAAIWYLGAGFGGIANLAHQLIGPLTEFTLTKRYQVVLPCRGRPRVQYHRNYQALHDSLSESQAVEIFQRGLAQKRTTGWSLDDACLGDLDQRTADLYGWPATSETEIVNWVKTHYPGVAIAFRNLDGSLIRSYQTPPASQPCRGAPRVQYHRIYQVLHPAVTDEQAVAIFRQGFALRRTTGWSFDDAGIGDLDQRTVEIYGCPANERTAYQEWFGSHYPGVAVVFKNAPGAFRATAWPVADLRVNQWFAANPGNYQQFGLPGHDGTDHYALTGAPVRAIAAGQVYAVYTSPNYGLQVRIDHGGGHKSIYAHLQQSKVSAGQQVTAGQLIALADSTGNSDGSHLHLAYKQDGVYTAPDGVVWPFNLFDPWLALRPLFEEYLATAGKAGYVWASSAVLHPHSAHEGFNYGFGVTNLNLRQAPDGNSPKLGLAPAHVPFRITGPKVNGYYPVVALLSSQIPGQQPPAGSARLGLHASADPELADGEVGTFVTAKAGMIKALSNLRPEDVSALAAALPAANWVVRAFLDFGGRNISPAQFVNDTLADVTRTLGRLGGKDLVVELHNEPNLASEGLLSSWADGTAFNTWFLDVLQRYRQALPGVMFIFPGLSPGHPVPGFRQQYQIFLNQCRPAVQAADGLGIHTYWNTLVGSPFTMAVALQEVDWYISQFPGVKIWVTEASNNKAGHPADKGQQYIDYWRALLARPAVQGVTYFVASASNPAFSEEVWVGRGIAEVVGQR